MLTIMQIWSDTQMSYFLVFQSRNVLQHLFSLRGGCAATVPVVDYLRVLEQSRNIQVLLSLHKEVAYSRSRQPCLVLFFMMFQAICYSTHYRWALIISKTGLFQSEISISCLVDLQFHATQPVWECSKLLRVSRIYC